MDKIKINRNNNEGQIDLKYDSEQYNIEYVVKRLIDDRVVKIFDDNIGFIFQYDEGKNSHFFVSCCVGYDNGNRQYKLRQYIDYYHLCDELILNEEISVNAFYLDDFNIGYDSSFMSIVQGSSSNSTRYGCFRFGDSTSMMPYLTFSLNDLANNIDKLNSTNLRFLASELFIKGRSKMSIDELREQMKNLLLTTKTIGSIDINNCLSENNPESSRLWTVDEFVEKYQPSKKVKKIGSKQ